MMDHAQAWALALVCVVFFVMAIIASFSADHLGAWCCIVAEGIATLALPKPENLRR